MSKDGIESDAEALLVEFARARNLQQVTAPVPIEDIVEKHLKLGVEFGDLHRLLGVPRTTLGESDIFGAIWLETGEIVIDESLDPEERPWMEERYLHTLAHEGCGHGWFHRRLVQASQGSSVQPTVVCRSSGAKAPIEWQADFYASCVLMPRKLVFEAWRADFGSNDAVVYNPTRASTSHYRIAERFAPLFRVSTQAMRIRLKALGLLRHDFRYVKLLRDVARWEARGWTGERPGGT
jgi:Zn-dependent peptidase ImmA (M78 family)